MTTSNDWNDTDAEITLHDWKDADAEITLEEEHIQPDGPMECPAVVHESVCIQAEITITPIVTVGEIRPICLGGPIIGACPGAPAPTDSCSFTVSQNICVQVPLTFSARVTAEPIGIVCGTPTVGTCFC